MAAKWVTWARERERNHGPAMGGNRGTDKRHAAYDQNRLVHKTYPCRLRGNYTTASFPLFNR